MKKKTLALIVVLVMIFGMLCACTNNESQTDKVTVWSTYNTTKVIQQAIENDVYANTGAKLSVEMMKGETEGAQLIVTATKDVKSFDLQISDLKTSDGKTISKENITVYQQKYSTITRNLNGGSTFHAGDSIPDMLLPLETSKAYGENTISAGNNQGITVEINSDETEAGEYSGEFTLVVDGKSQQIPVNVTVWDIEYTERRTFMSSFLIYCDNMCYGEYDNSKEMVDAYIDFFADYNVDVYPVRDTCEATHFTEQMENFANDKDHACIVIPVDFPLSYTAATSNSYFIETYNYIKEMAIKSTDDLCFVEYAYFYPSTYDEADIVSARQAPSEKFFSEDGEYAKTLQLCVELLQEESEYMSKSADLRKRIENAILAIPAVFTNVGYVENWVNELYTTFCPYVTELNDYANRQRYQDMAEAHANGNLWIYSCNCTDYPFPTFDIDDETLNLRVNSWMCKDYGVNGYLYYDVCKYSLMFSSTPNEYVNVYDDPNRGTGANGDGYVVYPGAYYGIYGPLPSLRLTTYRDSMDDYDMLCVLESKLADLSAKYGTTIDFDSYVSDLYNKLFDGTIAFEDNDETFYAVRRELANRILALENADDFVATYSHDDVNGEVEILCNKSQISVDGKTQNGEKAGDGYKYVIKHTDGANHTYNITVGSNSYSYSVNGYKVYSIDNIKLSTGSIKDGDLITIKSISGRYSSTSYPTIKIDVNDLPASNALHFSYTNKGSEEFKIQINLIVGSTHKSLCTNYCPAGTTRNVEIRLDSDIEWADVTALEITFKNVDSAGNLLPDKTLTISDLWFELK